MSLAPLFGRAPATTTAPDPLESAAPFWELARHGDATALVHPGGATSYRELAELVEARRRELGETRRLVLLPCRNDLTTVVGYLAALTGGHPVILVGAESDHAEIERVFLQDPAPDLHPDLAVLLSTSGSTGSPKLVRLSHDNLRSNATSIATYLGLRADDCAATTLPLQYSYGLSVLNSHLAVGASVLLTEASVVDACFWRDCDAAGVSTIAGVPHTFDLLDSSGFADRELPSLRRLTVAGGRLAPQAVRRYAELGRRRGFDLVVMYGATEATARMAYLPPELAATRPECIGIAIPGGRLRVDAARDGEVGELVYTGPNVMLGYATSPADLALGRTVHELRTGDLARRHPDGLVEVVGRTSRIAKVLGLRIDLDRVEDLARGAGTPVLVVEHDARLQVFMTSASHTAGIRELLAGLGVPRHLADLHVLARLPLTAHGKPDRSVLRSHAEAVQRQRDLDDAVLAGGGSAGPARRTVDAAAIRDVFAHLLGRPDATIEDSFITLRGDSLSYVEASVRLGRLLPDLPADWPQLSARELATLAPHDRHVGRRPDRRSERLSGRRAGRYSGRRWARVETSVLLRALAIVLIVASHADVISVQGGAHALLAVLGFNLARFQLSGQPRDERRRSLLRAAAVVAIPTAVWVGGVALLTGMYDASTALLLNNALGSSTWDERWQFWFLEVMVWSAVGLAGLMSMAAVDRVERARPFAFAAGVFAAALVLRYALVGVEAGPTERYAVVALWWCLALGWMAARARTSGEQAFTAVAAVVGTWGFFGDPVREAVVVVAVVALLVVSRVPVPRLLVAPVSTVAAASLFVYLTHWQVYPHLEDAGHPYLAVLASIAVGLAAWRAHEVVRGRLAGRGSAGSLYFAHARLRRRRPDHGRARLVPQARAR